MSLGYNPKHLYMIILVIQLGANQMSLGIGELNLKAPTNPIKQSLLTQEPPGTVSINSGAQNVGDMVASMDSGSGEMSFVSNSLETTSEASGANEFSSFDWHMKLDQGDKYGLDWRIHYEANEILFALNINERSSNFRSGADIFALGFSNNGQLASSDFCLIWYDLGHRLHLQDARVNELNGLELIDLAQSHCKLVSSSSMGGQIKSTQDDGGGQESDSLANLSITFRRPLDVCHSAQPYYHIDNGTTHLVWFVLKGPLLSLDGLDLGKAQGGGHNESSLEWGMRRVQLIGQRASRPKLDELVSKGAIGEREQHRSMEIRMDRLEVPARETTYWCRLFKLPHKFQQRRFHVTKYAAIVEPANEQVVHHMELFNCANLDAQQALELESLHQNGGWQGECNANSRPRSTSPCKRVILAWAMGAHPLEYPEQVGQSIGGPHYSPFVVLEVHYNNMKSVANLVDSSGLSFEYTSKLRKFDAGILEIGLEYGDKNSIPPGMVTPIAGYCVGECTRAAMSRPSKESLNHNQQGSAETGSKGGGREEAEAGGIYVFASQLHTHLAGIATWTELIRAGQLVQELQRDDHYSPHFQEIRLLPEPVRIAPGDALIHYCLYDTRSRANITLGGFATSEEMCVSYLHYYPRIDLEVCKSSVDTRALGRYFSHLAQEEGQRTGGQLSAASAQEVNSRDRAHQPARGPQLESPPANWAAHNYRSIEWSRRRAQELIQFYSRAPLSIQCNRANGEPWPGGWSGIEPTRLRLETDDGPEAFNLRPPASGAQLAEYRGRGHKLRHARCRPAPA